MRISDWSSDVCSSDLPMQHRHGLLEIDDVNAVPDAEEVRRDLRVPAAGVVTEVDAGLEELAHGEGGSNHLESFFRLNLRRPLSSACMPGWPWTQKNTGATHRLIRQTTCPRVWL